MRGFVPFDSVDGLERQLQSDKKKRRTMTEGRS